MTKYIRVKNDIPELLEALCLHPDCPEWLSDGFWDQAVMEDFNIQDATKSIN